MVMRIGRWYFWKQSSFHVSLENFNSTSFQEMCNWLDTDENIIGTHYFTKGIIRFNPIIHFELESDLILFKLRWL